MTAIFIVLITVLTFYGVKAPGAGGKTKSDFSYSREDQFSNPDEFWPVASSLHGDGAPVSSITAVLYNAVLAAGEADLDAVQLDGTPGSYMKIANTGELDGQDAFLWAFNLYPNSTQTATILEYAGTGGSGNGVMLSQQGTSLTATVYDKTGVLLGEYTRDILTINSWNFVGFSYNKVWGHIDIILNQDIDYHDITMTDQLVNALGDVTIGNSVDGSSPFNGQISCIQFYKKALFNNALLNPPSYCSLAQWTSTTVLDWTDTFVPTTTSTSTTTTTPTTTAATTTATTTPTTKTSTSTTTTTTPTTTATMTTTTTTPTTTTSTSTTATTTPTTTTVTTTTTTATITQTTSMTTSTTTTPATPTSTTQATTTTASTIPQVPRSTIRGYQETLTDTCYYFTLKATARDLALADVIDEKTGTSLSECARFCTANYQCVVFVTNINGDCRLSDFESPTLTASPEALSSNVYAMTSVDTSLYA